MQPKKKMHRKGIENMNKLLLAPVFLLIITACMPVRASTPFPSGPIHVVTLTPEGYTDKPQPNIANPAAVYCEEQGNRLEIRTKQDGSQEGICIFPDGSECEEWSYLRGECGPRGTDPAVENKAIEAAKIRLASEIGVDPSEITVFSIEGITWPNNCLGIPSPADACAWVETPGFRVVLTVGNDHYTYHRSEERR